MSRVEMYQKIPGYESVHDWMRKNFGKPYFCEGCGIEEAYRFEWANISGKYLRDKCDWIRLCASCHDLFERNPIKRKKIKLFIDKLH